MGSLFHPPRVRGEAHAACCCILFTDLWRNKSRNRPFKMPYLASTFLKYANPKHTKMSLWMNSFHFFSFQRLTWQKELNPSQVIEGERVNCWGCFWHWAMKEVFREKPRILRLFHMEESDTTLVLSFFLMKTFKGRIFSCQVIVMIFQLCPSLQIKSVVLPRQHICPWLWQTSLDPKKGKKNNNWRPPLAHLVKAWLKTNDHTG